MVLNRAVSKMDSGAPYSPNLERDPHVMTGTPGHPEQRDGHFEVDGDDVVTVVVETDDGVKHRIEAEVVRFDSWSSHHGFGGHNLWLKTDDDWVQEHDPVDDYLIVRTRTSGTSEVLANRKGAGLNFTLARVDAGSDALQVYDGRLD